MGVEKISGQAGYQSQAVQAVSQTNKVNVQPASEANNSQDTVNNTVHTAAVMQISSSQKSNTEDNNSGADTSTKQQQEQQASIQKLKDIQKVINHNTVAEFGYNEPTNRITIKIKDKDTDEVIKEIPSEKALEMLAKAWELAGIMVDEKR